jgi:hypothetical protein
MAFDRKKFKEAAQKRAKARLRAKMAEKKSSAKTTDKDALVAKIKEAVAAKIKESRKAKIKAKIREAVSAKKEGSSEDKKAVLKAKIKEAIAQARTKKTKVQETKQGKMGELRNQAIILKEKIQGLKKALKENTGVAMAAPVDAEVDPELDMGAIDGMGDGMEAEVPEEIAAQILNLKSTIDGLLVSAGLEEEENPAEGDLEAGIAPEEGALGDLPGTEDPVAALQEKQTSRRREIQRIRQKIKEKALSAKNAENNDYAVDNITDGSEMVDEKTQVSDGTGNKATTGVDGINGKGGKFSSVKAGPTWPTKPTAKGKVKEEVEEDGIEGEEDMEAMEENNWAEKQESRFIEKKQFSFKDLFRKGLLG